MSSLPWSAANSPKMPGQRPVDEASDEIALPAVVGVERGDDAGAEIALDADREAGGLEGRAPSVELSARTKVGVEEMSVRAQHAADLAQEGVEAAVAVRRLDVEHDVERGVGERQPLGVADLERQARVRETTAAERDGAGRQIDGDDPTRVELARHVVGAAAASAPDLEERRAPRRARRARPGRRAGCTSDWPRRRLERQRRWRAGRLGRAVAVVHERPARIGVTGRQELVPGAPEQALTARGAGGERHEAREQHRTRPEARNGA